MIDSEMEDKCCAYKCCIYYHFILYIIALIICFISDISLFINAPYNSDDFKKHLKYWSNSPIISISYNNVYLNNLNGKISQKDEERFSKMLELKHMDESYNYEYLLVKNTSDKNYQLCGTDSLGNGLYLKNGIECPINEI